MTLRKQHFFSDTEGPVYIQIQRDHDRLQDQNQFKPEKNTSVWRRENGLKVPHLTKRLSTISNFWGWEINFI